MTSLQCKLEGGGNAVTTETKISCRMALVTTGKALVLPP